VFGLGVFKKKEHSDDDSATDCHVQKEQNTQSFLQLITPNLTPSTQSSGGFWGFGRLLFTGLGLQQTYKFFFYFS